jgi:hypothetical protein
MDLKSFLNSFSIDTYLLQLLSIPEKRKKVISSNEKIVKGAVNFDNGMRLLSLKSVAL